MEAPKRERIYLDHAASTPVLPEVLEAMAPYWNQTFANAGAIHEDGVRAKRALEEAREKCAKFLSVKSTDIIFTSGGTESNNLAIFGLVRALREKGVAYGDMHFVTGAIEHASVLDCFKVLEKEGASITIVEVGEDGIVAPEKIVSALTDKTVLVSIMYANSEIGTIQPIREIGEAIRKAGKAQKIYFHTDACQAPVYLHCQADTLGVDLMTIDAQKLYGPKGSGFLYVKNGTPIASIMQGGNQERSLRPGTPVVMLSVGAAKACEIAEESRKAESERVLALSEHFLERVLAEVPTAKLNGSRMNRLPNNANFSFLGSSAEMIVLALDQKGISASTRSACHIGEKGASHVVLALGKGEEYAKSAVRFTLGRQTTKEMMDTTVEALKEILGNK
jgi:cysteine desulfurase